jgi:hypothetical protein
MYLNREQTMINKSATFLGTLAFANGNRTAVHVGLNSNLGTTIVWQTMNGGKPSRITGQNIARWLEEVDEVLLSGDAEWAEDQDGDRWANFLDGIYCG